MDGHKVLLTALIFIFLGSSGAAVSFEVNVGSITDSGNYLLKYTNTTDSVQRINVTTENTGSIGCEYRLKAVFNQGKRNFTRYSAGAELWPGASELLEINYVPFNYTGQIDTKVHSTYCGQEKLLTNFSFFMTERVTINNTIESETIKADESMTRIEVDVDEGLLVPEETPPYWKASSSRIVNGTAELRYDPPIFDPRKNLTYTVIDGSGERARIAGSTKVRLKTPETYWDRLKERLPKILGILLFFSVIINTKLLYDSDFVRSKIKSFKGSEL